MDRLRERQFAIITESYRNVGLLLDTPRPGKCYVIRDEYSGKVTCRIKSMRRLLLFVLDMTLDIAS